MAQTLATHRSGLLAYYDDAMITSGPWEGTNNKIKTMKRQAYGVRDMEFFKLKILAIHEPKYALVESMTSLLIHNDLRPCSSRTCSFRMN
jgi:transposase